MNDTSPLIMISSGGTGGHMSPAAALCADLISRGYRVELITDKRGQKYASMFPDIPTTVVRAGTLGKGLSGKISGALNLGMGLMSARKTINQKKPSLVVGFGGYPSVPGVLAAQQLKIPTVIHEQNAIIGKANAYLAPKAERIALSFPDINGLEQQDHMRAVVTGNPVRPAIATLYNEPYPAPQEGRTLRLLIMGGSLGASVFSEIVPQALGQLPDEDRARLVIVQQCRKEDLEKTKEIYAQADIKVTVESFIEEIAQELALAHLVIARSGASTVAEVTAAGRPSIFVPYPHHKDQQQKINADSVANGGGGWVMEEKSFTQEALLARISSFLQNPRTLFRAAEKAREFGKPDAARRLGNLVTAIVSGWQD